MSTNLPLGDYVRIALVTGVVLAAMILTANWLIENTLMPVLRGLWPVRGRHVADDYRPLDERIGAGDEEHERLLREEVYEADGGDTMHDDLADRERLTREHFDEWASGRFTHKGEDDEPQSDFKNHADDTADLTAEPGDEWPDTLHDLNAEHLVKPHEPDLDDLDRRIEAARQSTTADPALFRDIVDALGFESTALWEDHAWATVRGLAVGASA